MPELIKVQKEKDDSPVCGTAQAAEERYPYGTQFCLRDDLVRQLGIDHAKVGEEYEGRMILKVIETSESSRENERAIENDKRVEFQIVAASVTPVVSKTEDTITKLYG